MSTAVRLPNDSVRTREQGLHGGLVAIYFASFELCFQIFFQRKVEERVEDILILFARDLGHVLALEVLVFRQYRSEDELQVPAAREIASPTWIIGRLDRLKMQLGANRRVAEQLFALFQRRQHYGFPGRHGVEVLRRLQGITQISRPG